jgi:hypothetical protein
MNWQRGLFRLWIVGAALFVLAIAFISYGEIKRQFDAIAAKHLLAPATPLASPSDDEPRT